MAASKGGALRLTDTRAGHLGFLLLAGEGYPRDAKTFAGDCVFMPLPQDPKLFDGEPYLLLSEHRDVGEHRYSLQNDGATRSFEITGPLTRRLFVTLGEDGWGEWGYLDGAERHTMGYSHSPADAVEATE